MKENESKPPIMAAPRKGKRGTEVPRPFGSAYKGASALVSVHRTVGAGIGRKNRCGAGVVGVEAEAAGIAGPR